MQRTWTTFRQSAGQAVTRGVVWIKTGLKHASWLSHRETILKTVVVGAVALYLYRVWKNLPEKPIVQMVTSLNIARLNITKPPGKPIPPNVELTFCIDKSGSMDPTERIGAVKAALKALVVDAQAVIKNKPGAKIGVKIVQFDQTASVVSELTELDAPQNIKTINQQIDGLKCDGGTDILAGLELIAKADMSGLRSRTVVLLTDGEDNSLNADRLKGIQDQFIAGKVSLFAIGIGEKHTKATLQQIATSDKRGFSGKYIDTTFERGPTIQSSIATIYKEALASFTQLNINTTDLPAGSWSIGRTQSTVTGVPLGTLEEGKSLTPKITIHGERLTKSVDLKEVVFQLTFADPRGIRGRIDLPWNPGTVIDPTIVKN